MKTFVRRCALYFFLACCSAAFSDDNPDTHDSPFWVGYGCDLNGRTPSLSGKISKDYIAQFLPKSPVIVEAGAFTGKDTLEMSSLWPDAKIYAFEPMPSIIGSLKAKFCGRGNIKFYPVALGPKNGICKFYISSGASEASSSLLAPTPEMKDIHASLNFSQPVEVVSLTLDDWAESVGVSYVDFLWLDMQGVEPAMLKASPNILKTVKVIYSEVNLLPLYDGAILYSEFKSWLESQGFEVVREDMPWADGGDVLFIRKN